MLGYARRVIRPRLTLKLCIVWMLLALLPLRGWAGAWMSAAPMSASAGLSEAQPACHGVVPPSPLPFAAGSARVGAMDPGALSAGLPLASPDGDEAGSAGSHDPAVCELCLLCHSLALPVALVPDPAPAAAMTLPPLQAWAASSVMRAPLRRPPRP